MKPCADEFTSRNSAAQESQEMNRTLLQSTPYPVLVTELDSSVSYVNPAFEKLTGFTHEEILGHLSPYPWWPPEKVPEYEEANVEGRKKELNKLERYYQKKNGEIFWVAIHIAPVRINGGIRCFISNWVDVTEQKRAEEEADRLRQIMARVTRINTMGELATSLAHELNQPLTAILVNARTALRMLSDGKCSRDDLRVILEDIAADDQRAGEIIRRMREPLKRTALTLESLDVRDLIQEIYPLVQNEATAAGIKIELHLAAGLPRIRADRIQFQQVLLNLLVNALDAVKDQPVERRWIELSSTAEGKQSIRIEVNDAGHGISQNIKEHLFEPLYTTKPEGLGVGLSICKSLIEAHGGRIWHEERPEGGARFVFTLPVKKNARRTGISQQ